MSVLSFKKHRHKSAAKEAKRRASSPLHYRYPSRNSATARLAKTHASSSKRFISFKSRGKRK
ncbi:MAG: hypothetical protein [Wigfec virus K19_137]|nr:MAG: hypothetical protein [Wigfec virus K19_137]